MDTLRTSAASGLTLDRAHDSSLLGFDFVELYVGNALQAAHFYQSTFGFTPVARAGLDTGRHDCASVVLQQNKARLVVTSALRPGTPVGDAVARHGDAVKDIALNVVDAESVFTRAVAAGARAIAEPTVLEDENGRVVRATIGGPGELLHSLIERQDYCGTFMPGYRETSIAPATSPLVDEVDHVAVGVERGTLERWAAFYTDVLGFEEMPQEDTVTDLSGMRSTVVQYGNIRFPLLEPAEGRRRSQVEDFLIHHAGPGAQHVAFLSQDILATVPHLKARGIEFLKAPRFYYEMLNQRFGSVQEDVDALKAFDILLDRDEWGWLLQIFSKPVESRPTLFFEIIQRKEARGFGSGNIRALFQALELEQSLRGSL